MRTVPPRAKARSGSPQHVGPPLAVPAAAFVTLFIASLLPGPLLGAGPMPSPFSDIGTIQLYFTNNLAASQISGFLQFDAAIALAIFTAVTCSRLQYFAPRVPGPIIGLIGGVLASTFLGINGLLQWVIGQPGVTEQLGITRTIQFLFFVLGGPAHTSTIALLIAGIAVTAAFLTLLPRWLCTLGVAIAAISLLSLLTMVLEPLAPLIPVSRFTSMAWLITASIMLPRTRRSHV